MFRQRMDPSEVASGGKEIDKLPEIGAVTHYIKTDDWKIHRKTGTGTLFRSFQAVPFAAPPVGSLRFGAPQPVEPWTEERDASGWEDIKCVQYGFLYDEDPQVGAERD